MPLSLLLHIQSTGSAWREPKALRAIGFALLEEADPELAAILHQTDADKPLAVAAPPDAGDWLRVCALSARPEAALATAAGRVERARCLRRRSVDLVIAGVVRDAAPLAERMTFADLAQAPFHPRVKLRFATPTTFSHGGDRHLPLPVPELLFRGWARRWNAWAEGWEVTDETLARLTDHVGLAHASVETRMMALKAGGKVVGFEGSITLEALHPRAWSAEDKSAFSRLAAFSRFCGSGARTTQGMGLTLPDG